MKPENCWANRHIIYPIFRDAFLSKPAAYWVEQAALADLPLVRMAHFSDVSEDEQAWANGFVEHVQFPSGNVDVMPTSPIEMASAAPPATQPVAAVGAHTADVLRSLGYTDEQIAAMLKSGAAVAAE